MSDDLVKRLRAIDKDIILRRFDPEMSFDGMTAHKAADRIEKLETNFQLQLEWYLSNKRVLDDRIEKLEAALRSIAANACCDSCREAALVARKALEGKDD